MHGTILIYNYAAVAKYIKSNADSLAVVIAIMTTLKRSAVTIILFSLRLSSARVIGSKYMQRLLLYD